MTAAHDIHAETNPAFCAAVLAQFCQAYHQHQQCQSSLPTAYLVLPVALSEDLAKTFEGCIKSTGLLVWLERSPSVLSDLSKRVNATLEVTTEAIQFGCIAGLLRFEAEGEIASTNVKVPKVAIAGAVGSAFKRARLLGSWFAGAGSARAVMEAMRVSV